MNQIGLVLKTDGNNAEVEVKRSTACGHSCESCSAMCKAPSIIVNVPNSLGSKVRDYVEIDMKENKILKYAFIMYVIPFSIFLSGIFLGIKVFKKTGLANYEIYSFAIGLIFLAAAFFIVKIIDKRISNKKESQFEMKRII